ncbi:hypothetical protein BDB01DRAFT_770539 [Pilobolus umbonatus]|nr:hypothetical protein BDB01DRAFT_770539 [Pilobolus umbonatus]
MEDEDLERSGTLSRRQLTSNKPISIYPPVAPLPRRKMGSAVRSRNHRLLFILCTVLLLILYYKTKPIQRKNIKTLNDPNDILQFNETLQWTDYNLLTKLLVEKVREKDESTSSINRRKNTQRSIARQLADGSTEGHTFDELRRLTHNIHLPTISSGSTRRVPVTAIIHTMTVSQVYIQVQAVLAQTALPEYIWVICDTLSKANVEARIMTLDRRRVRVIARDNNQISHQWLQAAAHAATDYIWIIDQDIAPGKRYLENILKLSLTAQYKDTLLGTEAALLTNETQLECMPDAMHSGSRQMKSQLVDMINDSWVLHRSWISVLMTAILKEDREELPIEALTGLFISKTLYMNAGIPSVAIPTDPIERAYWGDVRLKKTKKVYTCKEIEKWMSTSPTTLHYRDIISTDTLLFLVDSSEELKSLGPLVCAFATKEDASVHIVTSGKTRGVSDLQIKTQLPELCENKTTNVIIHDLHILHNHDFEDTHLTTEVLHGLIQIIGLMEPQIMIHTLSTTRDLYKSINTVSELFTMPIIALPTEDIMYSLWMADLPIEILSKWNDFSIKLFMNIGKSPHSLTRLVQSAAHAYYLGDQVDITLLMDPSSDSTIHAYVDEYKWKHGRKYVKYRISPPHRTPLFVEAWYPSSNNEYAIILDGDIELSKFYYTWAKYSILRYRYMDNIPEEMFGISLYSPRITETDPSGRKVFNPSAQLEKNGREVSPVYTMQWITSSGAIFFPEHWREFHDYVTARLADRNGYQMHHRGLSELRSNQWHSSWRKYLDELVYLRSYVMLYPNFDDHVSLSTQHIELRKKVLREQYGEALSVYNVPLMEEDLITDELVLPDFEEIPIFDIWGKLSSFEILKERAFQVHGEISACVPNNQFENKYDPVDLLCPFSAIVTVPVKNEHQRVPSLQMREVTLFVEPYHSIIEPVIKPVIESAAEPSEATNETTMDPLSTGI